MKAFAFPFHGFRKSALAATAAVVLSMAGASAVFGQSAGEAQLKTLVESGKLVVAPTLQAPLEGGQVLSIVRVEVAPDVTEPRHTHPGIEVLYGLGGSGFVEIDGQKLPIEPGKTVLVGAGKAKALSNPSPSEPFSVLAVLVVDAKKPVLTVVD